MTKATLKQGFLQLANVLSEQFAARDFSEVQHAVIRVVERNTYGYRVREGNTYKARESFPCEPAKIAEATGVHVSNVRKAIAVLVEANVLTLVDQMLGFNTHTDEWKTPLRGVKSTRKPRVKLTPEKSQINSQKELNQTTMRVKLTRPTHPRMAQRVVPQAPKYKIHDKYNTKHSTTCEVSGVLVDDPEELEWIEDQFGVTTQEGAGALSVGSQEALSTYLGFSKKARDRARAALAQTTEPISRPIGFVLAALKDPQRFQVTQQRTPAVDEPLRSMYHDQPWGFLWADAYNTNPFWYFNNNVKMQVPDGFEGYSSVRAREIWDADGVEKASTYVAHYALLFQARASA